MRVEFLLRIGGVMAEQPWRSRGGVCSEENKRATKWNTASNTILFTDLLGGGITVAFIFLQLRRLFSCISDFAALSILVLSTEQASWVVTLSVSQILFLYEGGTLWWRTLMEGRNITWAQTLREGKRERSILENLHCPSPFLITQTNEHDRLSNYGSHAYSHTFDS